jgi:hypothetical protein
MVLRVFAGACVLFSLPPRVYYMIQICRRGRTEAQVALRTNLETSMRAIALNRPIFFSYQREGSERSGCLGK